MNEEEIQEYYDSNKEKFERLGKNITQSVEDFLGEHNIQFHSVNARVKKFDSFKEKIERKNYKNPKIEIEDFLGIRIICYYPSDLESIEKIILAEFDVKENINKEEQLEPDRFGYRSIHYIVTVKPEWCKAPSYRGLENCKAEIQVRTILMHAWADIEHKLAYKKTIDVPSQFRRKLSQISALLEVADQQFQSLKNERDQLKDSLLIEANNNKLFNTDIELNIDTLQAFLDFHFPKRRPDARYLHILLESLKTCNISIKQLEGYANKFQNVDAIEKDLGYKKGHLVQAGALNVTLQMLNDKYWEIKRMVLPGTDRNKREVLRKKYNK